MTRTAGAILAGGRGERLGGVDKATLEIGGRRLIDRVAASIAGCDLVVVSTGNTPGAGLLPGHARIADLDTGYAGPLAGVAAIVEALADSGYDLLLTVAVDTPFFPDDFLDRGRMALGGGDATLAAYAGQPYPTNALWRLSALAGLPRDVRAGTAPHSLKRLASSLGATFLDYAAWLPEDPFLNANTPADLALLRARADRAATG